MKKKKFLKLVRRYVRVKAEYDQMPSCLDHVGEESKIRGKRVAMLQQLVRSKPFAPSIGQGLRFDDLKLPAKAMPEWYETYVNLDDEIVALEKKQAREAKKRRKMEDEMKQLRAKILKHARAQVSKKLND